VAVLLAASGTIASLTQLLAPAFAAARGQAAVSHSGSSGVTLFLLFVTVWQAVVLSRHSVSFPWSILTGAHEPNMTPSCDKLFWVTNWSLFLSIFMIMSDCALMFAVHTRGMEGCLEAVKMGEAVANFVKMIIAVCGIFVVAFQVRSEETANCRELYSCAWWCFVGFLLVPCLVCGLFIAGVRTGLAGAQGSYPPAAGDALEAEDARTIEAIAALLCAFAELAT